MLDPRLTAVGRPVRASLGKVPVVLAAIVLLAGGIAGVLTINTMSDELGLQVSRTNTTIGDLQLQVEALQQAGRPRPPLGGPGSSRTSPARASTRRWWRVVLG